MAAQTGPFVRTQTPVLTWVVAPTLVALGIALALAAVVTIMIGMAPLALATLVGLVGSVVGFWSVLDRRG